MITMKKIIVALFILSGLPAFAQDTFRHGGSAEDVKILQELNEQHAKAFATANSGILNDRILADDFILIDSDGGIYRKQTVVERVAASRAAAANIISHHVENVVIRFVSSDVAMVHARAKFKMKDGTETGGTQYNDIYARRNGQWVCVSGNNAAVAPTAK